MTKFIIFNSDMRKSILFSVLIFFLFAVSKAESEPLFLVCNGLEQSFVEGNLTSVAKVQRTIEIKQNQENVWGVVIDNQREISKSQTTDEFEPQGIDVKDNEIHAFQESDTNDKNTYVLTINRISGKFIETLRTKYTGLPLTRRVLSGECAKVDRKI